jgi:hypothetical protein
MAYFVPTSVVTATGWTAVGAADLVGAVDEVGAADLADYAEAADAGSDPAPVLVYGISEIAAGSVSADVTLSGLGARARFVFLDGSNQPQGATAWQTLTDTPTDYTLSATLTGAATRVRVEVEPAVSGSYPLLPFLWG